jgi:hypothetical protein
MGLMALTGRRPAEIFFSASFSRDFQYLGIALFMRSFSRQTVFLAVAEAIQTPIEKHGYPAGVRTDFAGLRKSRIDDKAGGTNSQDGLV